MLITRLPDTVQTLYAELLDQSILGAAQHAALGLPSGTFISKEIKGGTYWYLQRSEGERKRQIYLGPQSEALTAWMENVRAAKEETVVDTDQRRRLCAMLRSGGVATEPAAVIKVLQLLDESCVFRLGGVLVDTLAFRVMANVLGVRFDDASSRTQDVDIAHDPAVGVALARNTDPINVEEALTEGPFRFLGIPSLDARNASTSFRIRGRELRVDFLTPMIGRERSGPVRLPAFSLSAQPLRFLDYLIDGPIQAVAIGNDAVLVNLPDPARFALHKLWLSSTRSATFQTKARKDLIQAALLAEILLEDRPTDLVAGWDVLSDRPGARKKILRAVRGLENNLSRRFLETLRA